MTKSIQAVKGMNDILPADMPYWHKLENELRQLTQQYAYQEIRTPILEKTELFKRSIGEVTDIVSKEMYTFEDRDGSSVTMRPEGTASVVRAGIEHGLFYNQTQKLWYLGPIFRHERPQRGRYRQFYQFGLEAVGYPSIHVEVEQILFNYRLWRSLGLEENLRLEINSLGSSESRCRYREVLVDYLSTHKNSLDEDSQMRLEKNPLRILDSKNPQMQSLIEAAPKMLDFLDTESKEKFDELQAILTELNVPFVINSRLVRGLDYYSETVFEWVTEELGAQGTVSAGGRYDALIAMLGGKATTAFGFAMGIERIVELLKLQTDSNALIHKPDIYFISHGQQALSRGLQLAELLRTSYPDLHIECNLQSASLKNQIKKADKSQAGMALILAEDEIAKDEITIKYLREQKPQIKIAQAAIKEFLRKELNSTTN